MKLAVVAGEASGDLHASEVIRELRHLEPGLETFGIGGDLLAKQKMVLLHHASEMGIVGLFNVLRHLPMFRRVFNELVARIEKEKPDAVLLVDYPDFNLRLARRVKELGIPVIYYISPQLWAWRRGRVRHIARYVDRMLVIFPFEEQLYRDHGVPVTYVGHPLIEQLAGVGKPSKQGAALRVALLPGSRRMEIAALLPAMLEAVSILRRERDVEAYVIQAPTIDHDELEQVMARSGVQVPILPHDRGEGIAAADVSLSSSGTATLESAVLGTPVVVMYRLSRATYALAKALVRLPYFSLVNIVAGKRVVPELIQGEVTGSRIAAEVRILIEPGNAERVRAEMLEVRAKLGGAGASRRAAEEIHKMVAR
ncbi:MAG TPA: lipid-A-disaccharide synthase [Thermoanaerobaculia bacterium]